MILVLTPRQVAAAFNKSTGEFENLRAQLETLGFPKPLRGLPDRWSILDVMDWLKFSHGEGVQLPDAAQFLAPAARN